MAFLVYSDSGVTKEGPLLHHELGRNSGGGGSGSGGHGIVFSGTVNLHGAETLSGTYVDADTGKPAGSCADYARAGLANAYYIPSPAESAPINGTVFGSSIIIDHYRGPADYRGTEINGFISVGSKQYQDRSTNSTNSTHGVFTTRADGSGMLTFSEWRRGLGADGSSITGTVEWTCANA